MGRAKFKPAVRRVKRNLIDAEKASIERWKSVAEKHEEGSFVYKKAMQYVRISEIRLEKLRGMETQ